MTVNAMRCMRRLGGVPLLAVLALAVLEAALVLLEAEAEAPALGLDTTPDAATVEETPAAVPFPCALAKNA